MSLEGLLPSGWQERLSKSRGLSAWWQRKKSHLSSLADELTGDRNKSTQKDVWEDLTMQGEFHPKNMKSDCKCKCIR
jgi:hypothetical protein